MKEPVFFKNLQDGNRTYELYLEDDVEVAKAWLLTKKVEKPEYYITVKTKQGTWGMDKEGLYLTNLLDWQTDISLAQFEASVVGIPNMFNLGIAERGIADNFVVQVQCGKGGCNGLWHDALRYQDKTIVRCPKCSSFNVIDTHNIHYMEAFDALKAPQSSHLAVESEPKQESRGNVSANEYVCPHCGSELQGSALITIKTSMQVGVIDFQTNCSSCGKVITKRDIESSFSDETEPRAEPTPLASQSSNIPKSDLSMSELLKSIADKYRSLDYQVISQSANTVIMERRASADVVVVVALLFSVWLAALIYALLISRKIYRVQLSVTPTGGVDELGDTIHKFEGDKKRARKIGKIIAIIDVVIYVGICVLIPLLLAGGRPD